MDINELAHEVLPSATMPEQVNSKAVDEKLEHVGNHIPRSGSGHVRHCSYDVGPNIYCPSDHAKTSTESRCACGCLLNLPSLDRTTSLTQIDGAVLSTHISVDSLSCSDSRTSITTAEFNDEDSSKRSSLDRRSCSDYSSFSDTSYQSTLAGHAAVSMFSKDRLANFLPRGLLSLVRREDKGAAQKVRSDVASTTALILENRPANLPAKSIEEEEKHRCQYEQMVEAAKRRERRDAKLKRKKADEQFKLEEALAAAVREWNDILPNWNATHTSRKVRDLWWLGLPPSVRGKVWKLAIGNDLNITPELYEICVRRANEKLAAFDSSSTSGVSCSSDEPESPMDKESTVELIHLDVSRTFPNLGIFQKGGPYYDLLLNLLGGYVCYRPDVGYVQGMSFVAAVLLLNLDSLDAFVCFANLLNRPCQIAFFHLNQDKMAQYFAAYDAYFQDQLPRLHAHFCALQVTPELYVIEWLYTLYAKSLPLDVACRVWDVFLRDGDEFLFRTALGILQLYEHILLPLDFDQTVQFLTHLPEMLTSAELFRGIQALKSADKRRFGQFLTAQQCNGTSKTMNNNHLTTPCYKIPVKSPSTPSLDTCLRLPQRRPSSASVSASDSI